MIYVVTAGEYEEYGIVGVFFSREAAEAWVKLPSKEKGRLHPRKNSGFSGETILRGPPGTEYNIEEYEVKG